MSLTENEFIISGTHCRSCKILLEGEIGLLPGVKSVSVNYASGKTKVCYDRDKTDLKEIYEKFESLNYHIVQKGINRDSDIKKILVFCLIFILLASLLLIKSLGAFQVFDKLNENHIGHGLIFLIGLLAGFHCVGMCGGMVVTYVAKNTAQVSVKKGLTPHLQYNLARIVSYTTIGAVLGGIGSFFAINPVFTGLVMLLVGIFMVILAISFFTDFILLDKIVNLFSFKYFFKKFGKSGEKTPLVLGFLNGFMPCGPLQAMQIYALGTGGAFSGGLSMLIFGLGTMPLMLGFGSIVSNISQKNVARVTKFSGLVIIILGLFMLNRGLIYLGLKDVSGQEIKTNTATEGFQVAKMTLSYNGYNPNILYVKKNMPVKWIIEVKQMSGCTDQIIMPAYNIKKELHYGDNVIEFTPTQAGEIKFSCWMQMVWGKFIVN